MTSKPAPSRATASSTANVRRNLFHHQLSRRPTSSSTSTTATTLQESLNDDSSDIVVKDRNGKYDVQVPLLPPLDEEQAQEEEVASEKEKLDARLLEMYKDRSLQPGEPAELMVAVQASLRRKVASLDDDNWMFEAEQLRPGN
ncbi:hypothetical protein N7G274_008233 [Stereocaulon virgatum]|uniref:Uncharacterized protein n=1 Tax=Stereocaulon virgatum TaxID=373712 RepID=A0ABR4A384_9LECA